MGFKEPKQSLLSGETHLTSYYKMAAPNTICIKSTWAAISLYEDGVVENFTNIPIDSPHRSLAGPEAMVLNQVSCSSTLRHCQNSKPKESFDLWSVEGFAKHDYP